MASSEAKFARGSVVRRAHLHSKLGHKRLAGTVRQRVLTFHLAPSVSYSRGNVVEIRLQYRPLERGPCRIVHAGDSMVHGAGRWAKPWAEVLYP